MTVYRPVLKMVPKIQGSPQTMPSSQGEVSARPERTFW